MELPFRELTRPSAAEGACLFWVGRAMELLSLRVELRMYRMELFSGATPSGARVPGCGELVPFVLSCIYLVPLSEHSSPLARVREFAIVMAERSRRVVWHFV